MLHGLLHVISVAHQNKGKGPGGAQVSTGGQPGRALVTFTSGSEGGSQAGVQAGASQAEGRAGVMNLRGESERLASSRCRVTQVHACACVCVCACVCRHLCVVHARVCVCAHRGHMPAVRGVNGMLFMQVCVCVCV